jgi:hypothetical protein
MNLDITFSDHHIAEPTLRELGAVVAAIHEASDDSELCFWTFIYYISQNHSSILGVNLEPGVQTECEQLLQQVSLPPVTMRPSPGAPGTH